MGGGTIINDYKRAGRLYGELFKEYLRRNPEYILPYDWYENGLMYWNWNNRDLKRKYELTKFDVVKGKAIRTILELRGVGDEI